MWMIKKFNEIIMKKWVNKALVSRTPIFLAIKLAANNFMSAV